MLGLIDILRLGGFDPGMRTKLVRHQDRRYPVQELMRNDWLELYQSFQSKTKFHGVEQIVSFYDLTRDTRFDDLRDRLIIDWGPGTLAWVQKLQNKDVLEIKEPGRKLPPFDDYLEFSLTHEQLKGLFTNEEAHRDWRVSLSAVAGIYLILAEGSGHLYVGSAYGESGFWGRWRNYAKTGDGGNVQLRQLIETDSDYPQRFRFSTLQILPKTMARDEVFKRESLYKAKLGSRATGLNSN